MNYLLDTHALIWFINGEQTLSANARAAMEDNSNTIFVSVASIWEMAIKISLGKLSLKLPFPDIYVQIQQNGFQLLPISSDDAFQICAMPFHHRDPFDRMLIAQGFNNRLTIITRDRHFADYTANLLW